MVKDQRDRLNKLRILGDDCIWGEDGPDRGMEFCDRMAQNAEKMAGTMMEVIKEMAKETTDMVIKSVDAFVNKDLELARWVINRDDVVDDLFDSFRKELIQKINENVKNGEMATDMLMVAKYFERIGDHATNIAEWVIYSITGKHEDE